jgi:hypothetical protein
VPDLNQFLRPLEINNEIKRETKRWTAGPMIFQRNSNAQDLAQLPAGTWSD